MVQKFQSSCGSQGCAMEHVTCVFMLIDGKITMVFLK